MWLILNVYRDTAVWMYKHKSFVNVNKERAINHWKFNFKFDLIFQWQFWYTEMTSLLHFLINVRKPHRQTQSTLQLSCEDRVLFVWADLQLSFCRNQLSKCVNMKFFSQSLIVLPPKMLVFPPKSPCILLLLHISLWMMIKNVTYIILSTYTQLPVFVA